MKTQALSKDNRIENFINENLGSYCHLESLENLISSTEIQQKQLKEQLHDVQEKLSKAKLASSDQTTVILNQHKEFEKLHDSIQKRLMVITSSGTPESALHKLKPHMDKLQKLKLSYYYIDFLKEIESLRNDSRKNLPGNSKLALKSYTELKEISHSLKSYQKSIGKDTLNLSTYLEKTTFNLWAEMKQIMCDDFEKLLQKSNWPDPTTSLSEELCESFRVLLDFQYQEILSSREPQILLPLKVMSKNFVLQFKYHFSGERPTNHPHRLGDYFFEWFLNTVARWEGFLLKNLTPILASYFRETPLSGNTFYVDPVAAFIASLLPILQDKVETLTREVLTQPQLLSQFIIQMMDFDDSLRFRFKFDGIDHESKWNSLTSIILDKYFENWYEIEKNFALDRYQEIIQAKKIGEIDYDSSSLGKTKATLGATQVTDLITNITFKYQRLQNFLQKIKFFIGIQAEILDMYQGRLNDALEYYQTATSTVGRTIHGVTKEELEELKGTKGLDQLCKIFCSADHLTCVLKDCMNEEFFILLYDQLQTRVASTEASAKIGNVMSAIAIKKFTSRSIKSDSDGSLFDMSIEAFEHLRSRAEFLISQAIKYDLPYEFRSYLTKSEWTTVGEISSFESFLMLISPELDQPLQNLETYLKLLHKTLGNAPFRRIIREVLNALQDLLFNELLLHQEFTPLGSLRLSQDIASILNLVNRYLPSNSCVPFDMPLLREATVLLNLSDTPENENYSFETVSKALFSSNQEATRILEKLDINHLSNSDARVIIERRIDKNLTEKDFS